VTNLTRAEGGNKIFPCDIRDRRLEKVNNLKTHNAISPMGAILAVLVTFMLVLFVGGAVVLVFENSDAVIIALVFSELLIIVVPLGYMLSKKVDVKSYIGLDAKPRNILLGIAFGAFLFLFDVFITSALFSILGPSKAVEESNTLTTDLSSSSQGVVSVAVWLVLAGICEEFTFRGFLQNALNRKYSFIPAVLISSLAWGLFHFDPQFIYIISIFLAGLILGYVYHRSHSYVISAMAHSTLNLIVLATLLLVK
jgi:membrane protease YdiL (CAAX protease family)